MGNTQCLVNCLCIGCAGGGRLEAQGELHERRQPCVRVHAGPGELRVQRRLRWQRGRDRLLAGRCPAGQPSGTDHACLKPLTPTKDIVRGLRPSKRSGMCCGSAGSLRSGQRQLCRKNPLTLSKCPGGADGAVGGAATRAGPGALLRDLTQALTLSKCTGGAGAAIGGAAARAGPGAVRAQRVLHRLRRRADHVICLPAFAQSACQLKVFEGKCSTRMP